MSFTYHGDPSESDVTQVRFLIQDIDPESVELQDEEIDFLLTQNNQSVVRAAIAALYALATKYARWASFSMEGASVSYASVSAEYRRRAKDLADDMRESNLTIFWTPPQDEWGNERPPIYTIGMHDFLSDQDDGQVGDRAS